MKRWPAALLCFFSISTLANPTINVLIPNQKSGPLGFTYDNYSTLKFKIVLNDRILPQPIYYSRLIHPLYSHFESDEKKLRQEKKFIPAQNWWHLSASLCRSDSKLQCASIMHGEKDRAPTFQLIRFNPKKPIESVMVICNLKIDSSLRTRSPDINDCMRYSKPTCEKFVEEYKNLNRDTRKNQDKTKRLWALLVENFRGEEALTTDVGAPFDHKILNFSFNKHLDIFKDQTDFLKEFYVKGVPEPSSSVLDSISNSIDRCSNLIEYSNLFKTDEDRAKDSEAAAAKMFPKEIWRQDYPSRTLNSGKPPHQSQ